MLNKQPVQIPSALQALMVLQQQANPVAPNGRPTIAGQMAQKAQQGIMQPMMASAPSMDESQGIADVLNQVRGSMPSVQQDAQAQGIAQRVVQMMQPKEPGVTGLPANNMGFAEGGIIGYDGEESYVNDPTVAPISAKEATRKDNEGIAKAFATIFGLPASFALDVATSPINAIRNQYMSAANKPAVSYTPAYDAVTNWLGVDRNPLKTPPDDRPERVPGKTEPYTALPKAEEKGVASLLQQQKPPAGGAGKISASVRSPGATPASSFDPKKIMDSFLGDDYARQAANRAEQVRLANEGKTLREGAPPPGKTALDSIAQTRQELQALHDKANSESAMNGLRAWLQGAAKGSLGGAGAASSKYDEDEKVRMKGFINQKLLLSEKQAALEDAQQAKKEGNFEKYKADMERVFDIDAKMMQTKAGAVGSAISALGGIEGDKIRAAAQTDAARLSASVRGGTREEKILALRERLLEAANTRFKKDIEAAGMLGPIGAKARAALDNNIKQYVADGVRHIFGPDAPGASKEESIKPSGVLSKPKNVTVTRAGD